MLTWEYGGVTYSIIWKQILICFVFVMIIGLVYGHVSYKKGKNKYKKICEQFRTHDFINVEKEALRLWQKYDVFTILPTNKNMYILYNNLCYILASVALIKGDVQQFLSKINSVKKEQLCEHKSFMLALYYRGIDKYEISHMYYEKYLGCINHDHDLLIIMNALFLQGEGGVTEEILNIASKFQNPAIRILLKVNGLY